MSASANYSPLPVCKNTGTLWFDKRSGAARAHGEGQCRIKSLVLTQGIRGAGGIGSKFRITDEQE